MRLVLFAVVILAPLMGVTVSAKETDIRAALDRANAVFFTDEKRNPLITDQYVVLPDTLYGHEDTSLLWLSRSELQYTKVESGKLRTKVLNVRTGKTKTASIRQDRDVDEARQVISPSGLLSILTDGKDLFVKDIQSGKTRQLTDDGGIDTEYAKARYFKWSNRLPHADATLPPSVLWSPDSQYIFTFQADTRGVRRQPLWALKKGENGALDIEGHEFVASIGSDQAVVEAHLVVINIENGEQYRIELPQPYVFSFNEDPTRYGAAKWSMDSNALYVRVGNRTSRRISLYRTNIKSGKTTKLLERDDLFGTIGNYYQPLPGGNELLWDDYDANDRGLGLHLIDANTGEFKKRLTSDHMSFETVVAANAGSVFFTGSDLSAKDPYLTQLFRYRLRDGSLKRLTTATAEHRIESSPDSEHFAVAAYTYDAPPKVTVINAEGEEVTVIAQPDFSGDFRGPERVSAIGQDNLSEVFGVLYKPYNFDETNSYPVVQWVHGTATFVLTSPAETNHRHYQAMADLGFIVMVVDGMGNTRRTRNFLARALAEGLSEPCVGNKDAALLMQSEAKKRPYMDLTRVGVSGMSQGGRCSTRALLTFPETFHVGVSYAGSHELHLIHSWDGYAYLGDPRTSDENDNWRTLSGNTRLVDRLAGKLLLVHGLLDDDTHPINTIAMADALIEANKDFQMLMVPNYGHEYEKPYVIHSGWRFLVKHLRNQNLPVFN